METLCNSRAVWVSAVLTFVAILPFAHASQGRGVNSTITPLKLDLPAPGFRDTPPNLVNIPNLEPVGKTPRPPFYAPAGATNLALGKPVASTDDLPVIGELEMITDGDKQAQDGSFVELDPFVQHVTIDLEEVCEVYAIVVWHWQMQARVYFDVVVQIADDADFISNVRTVFNNDTDNSAGLGVGSDRHYVDTHEGRLVDAKGQRARYVRLHSNGNQANDLNQYTEVEVWGRLAEGSKVKEACERLVIDYPQDAKERLSVHWGSSLDFRRGRSSYGAFMVPVGTENVALSKKVASSDGDPVKGAIDMIVDGNKASTEDSIVELGPFVQHVTIDLGDLNELYAIVVWRDHHRWNAYRDVVIQISRDVDFIEAVTLFNNDSDNSIGLGIGVNGQYLETNRGKMISAAGLPARYVRIYSNGCNFSDLNRYVEVCVYGRPYAKNSGVDRLIPLNFELPRPMFTGHGMRMPPNTERRTKPRETFYAPTGCVNLAAGKVVSSTDELPIVGKIAMITDGDKEAADGSYVELGPGLQHVTIDLEDEYEIYAVLFWHFSRQSRVYYDVIVRTADDMDFTENVHILFNNDIDNSAGLGVGDDMHYIDFNEGKLIDAGGVTGRYVRLYSKGNTSNEFNHYVEVEVWGRPLKR